uniref:Uncharacterized protein n=1 Tax=viral metagenome TaxID=1070528 RepID=A0A6M3JMP8_9ZZZZ
MKPRLLDLFCGAIDAQNKICYGKPKYLGGLPCIKSFALTVDWKLMQSDRKGKSFALIDVANDSLKGCPTSEIAEFAERHFLLIREIKTVGIALKNAAKRHIKRIPYAFMNHIQIFTINITRRVLSRTLEHGKRNTTTNDLRLFVFLAGSV